ncbi:putative ABC transporter B family member 19 [Iris pallida]|uniref:ABC transporter B family member 19 n=1 Tax=Iris pallida TaxID=29817 RepID=A0AAX6FP11_IRIPA|nr:putative ABC transporter B family member 19 [Iris pallida]
MRRLLGLLELSSDVGAPTTLLQERWARMIIMGSPRGGVVGGCGEEPDGREAEEQEAQRKALHAQINHPQNHHVCALFRLSWFGYAEIACWMYTGERQVSMLRRRYLETVLRQDVGFFNTDARTGDTVFSVATNTLL